MHLYIPVRSDFYSYLITFSDLNLHANYQMYQLSGTLCTVGIKKPKSSGLTFIHNCENYDILGNLWDRKHTSKMSSDP